MPVMKRGGWSNLAATVGPSVFVCVRGLALKQGSENGVCFWNIHGQYRMEGMESGIVALSVEG